jgi:hypothetical protein
MLIKYASSWKNKVTHQHNQDDKWYFITGAMQFRATAKHKFYNEGLQCIEKLKQLDFHLARVQVPHRLQV